MSSIAELNVSKKAPVEGLIPVLANRWSPRAFLDKPLESGQLKSIMEAAQWSLSSGNTQPWRFFVGVHGTETYDKIFAALVPGNQIWAGKAAVLVLGVAPLKNDKGATNAYALYDLGQASALLTIQATGLGLATHSMGGFDREAAKAAFGLGEDYGFGAVIAIGHQAEPEALGDKQLIDRETAPRQRKPLAEIALTGLGQPFAF